jgi:phosphoribosylformimino-5-aminoimidazole carboxamide ribotide isomerase
MKIIPVVDLMRGQVVRGVAGKRDQYRPIASSLCDEPSPAAVGAAFRRLGFNTAYVADLDAIAGGEPNWAAYETLIDNGFHLWVDAGAATWQRAANLTQYKHGGRRLSAVIVGSESLRDIASLEAAIELLGPARLIFSLDLQSAAPITQAPPWQSLSAERIAKEVIGLGIRRMIALDLQQVGVNQGLSTLDLCRRLRQSEPSLEIISGGGVRHLADLRALAQAGCNAALVASALHDGRLSAAEIALAALI